MNSNTEIYKALISKLQTNLYSSFKDNYFKIKKHSIKLLIKELILKNSNLLMERFITYRMCDHIKYKSIIINRLLKTKRNNDLYNIVKFISTIFNKCVYINKLDSKYKILYLIVNCIKKVLIVKKFNSLEKSIIFDIKSYKKKPKQIFNSVNLIISLLFINRNKFLQYLIKKSEINILLNIYRTKSIYWLIFFKSLYRYWL